MCSTVCTRIFFFSHSPIVGLLGCFHILAFLKNAAVNMGVQIPPQEPGFILYVLYILSHIVLKTAFRNQYFHHSGVDIDGGRGCAYVGEASI